MLRIPFPRLDVSKQLLLLLQDIIAKAPNTYYGEGDPNGVVTGSIPDLYLNTSGGAGATLWVKESGNNTNTGWVAK